MKRWIPVLIIAAAQLVFSAAPVRAVPPFARRYRVSCNLCHSPAPRLNAFGEQFAANGFMFAAGEEPRDTIATGDPLLALASSFPIGLRIDAYTQALTTVRQDETRVDLQVPYGIKLFSSGLIAKNISYYLYFFLTERGEIAGLEDAYVQFSDIGGSGIALIGGQFQVSDPLFKRELRLEFEDYQVYRVRVGDARADLTYDRGFMALYSPWQGGDLALQVLTGRGLDPAGENRQFDRDPWKNVALRYSQDIGPFRVGGFGMVGTEEADGVKNRFTIWGPDATLQLGPAWELSAQYLRRNDDDPFYTGGTAAAETTVQGGFTELIWSPAWGDRRWHFTGLVNWLDSDEPVFKVRQGEADLLDSYRSAAVGVNYLLRRNLRLLFEPQYDLERERVRLTAGFTAAF